MDLTNRISRAEIAEQLGVQTQTIAKWERTGRFPRSANTVARPGSQQSGVLARLSLRFPKIPKESSLRAHYAALGYDLDRGV
jgi:hypothetical protein